jgi:phosphatidylserine/phosphatidylglycerophosphate/cardiolipin synthase-like enzyme
VKEHRIMPGFDIGSLLNFEPARFQCERCLGLLKQTPKDFTGKTNPTCPLCKVTYIATDTFSTSQMDRYLEHMGYSVQIENIFEHCKNLATIALKVRSLEQTNESYPPEAYPPLRGLFEALNYARQFVHFTSYGISHLLIGALKLAAQRVSVRGLISGIDEQTKRELEDFKEEAPRFAVRTFAADNQWKEIPHQKLLVIDGLLAFKGSANLTLNAWRKAAQGLEILEVVSDVEEVINLHNKYFSPIWKDSATKDWEKEPTIEMYDYPW